MKKLVAMTSKKQPKINFKKIKLATISSLFFTLVLTGCQAPAMSNTVTKPTTPNTDHSSTQNPSIDRATTLTQQARHIQQALASGNYAAITNDIHPTRGVRFSMYAYVRPESDKVFSRAQFAQYLTESNIRFTWGDLDGTGDPLVIPLPKYLQMWVDAGKFNTVTPSINAFEHSGNMINNIDKIYQNHDFVEFYYNGTEEYAGMDWRILRLVFDEYQGQRYLVAIINEQWTV